MCTVSVVACAAGAVLAMGLGGGAPAFVAVLIALAICAALTIIPLLGRPLVTAENWGLVVLGVSAARTFVAMGALLFMVEALQLPRRPVVYGVLAGASLLLVSEAIVAVMLLTCRERSRVAQPDAASSASDSGSLH